jgi:VCBS repeat-containing protein
MSISGTINGTVIDDGGVNNGTPGTPFATSTLTDTADPPNTFQVVSTPTASVHAYGNYTMTSDGTWTYTLDNTNSTVQALNVGGTLTDTFTVMTTTGAPQVITITIDGANDAAVVSGTIIGSVTEAGGVNNGTPGTHTATGTLTDTDVDNATNTFQTVTAGTTTTGGYGTYALTAGGAWT